MSTRPEPQDEAAIIEELAKLRWGPTGFCCRHCDHRHAYVLRARPRMRECRRCGRQISVTSGTLLHRTRLPLSVWKQRGEQAQSSAYIPPIAAQASELKIARSTAWLLNHKMLCALARRVQGEPSYLLVEVRVRKPMRTPAMPASAPP